MGEVQPDLGVVPGELALDLNVLKYMWQIGVCGKLEYLNFNFLRLTRLETFGRFLSDSAAESPALVTRVATLRSGD